ncbi:MAG: GYD domain-containing protein [Halobacteriota archaeon]
MDSSRDREGKGRTTTNRTRCNTFKAVCGELKDLYFTFGKYDIVTIAEAPSDEAMGRAALITAGFGAVRIETVKAFPEAEGYEIIKGLP